jgi:hypothetical protein
MNPVLLNNVDHKELRVITKRGAAYGDDLMFSLAIPAEFRTLQMHYPLVFRKSNDGATFESVALFGFQEGENLFLNANGWDATDVPLAVERHPFLIGVNGDDLMVHVDMDSPRLSRTEGEPAFLTHGGNTEYLERINSILLAIHEGLQSLPSYVAALMEHELLESFVLDIELNDGSQNRLAGFYTINEDKLNALGGAALERLHKNGYLHAIYMQMASLSNFRSLIERKNRANAAGR